MKMRFIQKSILTLLIAGILIGFYIVDQRNLANTSGEVTIQIVYSEENIFEETLTFRVGDTLFNIISRNYEFEYVEFIGLGRMVTRIRDLKQTQNSYIMIFVDGEMSMVGIDGIELKDGLFVTFILM